MKRLDITGFKSFRERTVLSFDNGITCVVGPNGCGKSNIVDAIRWAMGEQSAKHLRGRGMEDVIFSGSQAHASVSMAEVTLTLAVTQGDVLPEALKGMAEIAVTRRLFRDGESEYQINKSPCRLLDITELFLGTGVGTRAYSIVEQGRVGQIVSARPEDRRSFIEEAAGITKYKARRRAAERKMEHTQHNLLRINDIANELKKRHDSLKRQAQRAEKYRQLKAEMRDIELHAASHRWLELHSRQQVLGQHASSLCETHREADGKVEALESDIAARRETLERDSQTVEALAAERFALQGQLQLDAHNLKHWQADLDATHNRLNAVEVELAGVIERKAQTESQKAEGLAELEQLTVASKSDEVALEVSLETLRRTEKRFNDVTLQLNGEQKALVEAISRTANDESRLEALQSRRLELEKRQIRLKNELDALEAEVAQLQTAHRDVLALVERHREAAQALNQRRGKEEISLERLREAFAANEALVVTVREALAEKRSRLASLKEIQHNYEGFDRGVRAVMLKVGREPRQSGVFGPISDFLMVSPEHEKAIEAALGEQLQHVVVETAEHAFQLLEYLKASAEGRSTFVPIHTKFAAEEPIFDSPGVIGMGFSQIQLIDETLRPLMAQLLSGIVLVVDLEVAKRLSLQHPTYTFVTRDGEVLRPNGTIAGGSLEGPAIGALQKKREIAELSQEVVQLETRYNERITEHYALQKQIGHVEGVLKGLERTHHAEEISLASHERDLHQTGSSLQKLHERIASLSVEHSELTDALTHVARQVESTREALKCDQTDRQSRAERVELFSKELEALNERVQALNGELTALKVQAMSMSERKEAAMQRVAAFSQSFDELSARVARMLASQDEGRLHAAALVEKIAATEVQHTERRDKLQWLSGHVETQKSANGEHLAQVRVDEGRLKALREEAAALSQDLSRMQLRERELALELGHLSNSVFERHHVPIVEALSRYHHAPILSAAAQDRLVKLRTQIQHMGEVNLTAIQECQEVEERHTFLVQQQGDLEYSMGQLKDAIVKIDKTSQTRFNKTFEDVNEKFQQVFPRLFGSGRASLMLVQATSEEEPGVEILAQPGGKKLQNMSLLSGGEKALTAVALLLSIFLTKPTPFCLLDEVDAPLDDGNVGRYNEMLRNLCQISQFILITHNKRTMEGADSLYGVTMEDPGISKLVTVKFNQPTANQRVA